MQKRTFEQIEIETCATPPNFYKVLGLEREATTAEIKKAFRYCSRITHPDKNSDKVKRADDVFKIVCQAYRSLIDPLVRTKYDKTGNITDDCCFYKYQHLYGAVLPVMPAIRAQHLKVVDSYDVWIETDKKEVEYSKRIRCPMCTSMSSFFFDTIFNEPCDNCNDRQYLLKTTKVHLKNDTKKNIWYKFKGEGDQIAVDAEYKIGDLYIKIIDGEKDA